MIVDLFEISIEKDTIKISSFLYGMKSIRKLWELYPKNKLLAMQLIQYALYSTDLSRLNPYKNMPMVERKAFMQNTMFGRENPAVKDPSVLAAITTFRKLYSLISHVAKVKSLKNGLSQIHAYNDRFNQSETDVTSMKEFAMYLVSAEKVENLVILAEEQLTTYMTSKIQQIKADGTKVVQYYD